MGLRCVKAIVSTVVRAVCIASLRGSDEVQIHVNLERAMATHSSTSKLQKTHPAAYKRDNVTWFMVE